MAIRRMKHINGVAMIIKAEHNRCKTNIEQEWAPPLPFLGSAPTLPQVAQSAAVSIVGGLPARATDNAIFNAHNAAAEFSQRKA